MAIKQFWSPRLTRLLVFLFLVVFYCEFLHYYIVLIRCTWPTLSSQNEDITIAKSSQKPVRAMVIADTHLLGSREGHWFDKLRREWQMQRVFQTSMSIHSPDVVFVLGDLFDEGKWCSDTEFQYHVDRFRRMFRHSKDVALHAVVGNHDVGFHYDMTLHKNDRFQKAFNSPSVRMQQISDSAFVFVNSMAMEGDNCNLCADAVQRMNKVSQTLKCWQGGAEYSRGKCKDIELSPYSRPILLQHFPMYRPSDVNCSTPDAAPEPRKSVPFRENFDCLSKRSSKQIFKKLNPRLILSGHTHHGCYRVHDNGTPEWTVSSLSWRNTVSPTFLLVVITSNNFAIQQCEAPNERTVIYMYIIGALLSFLSLFLPIRSSARRAAGWSSSVNKKS